MKRKYCDYDIPRELEEQILLKLPVKSLVRFRSVCKSWKSLITSDKFVKDHLQVNIHKSNSDFSDSKVSSSVLVVFEDEYELLRKLNSLLTVPGDYNTTVEKIYVPKIPGNEQDNKLVSYECNGINCWVNCAASLLSPQQRVVFYNPALREHQSVTTSLHFPICYGFGHDPETDEYKFVRILERDGVNSKAEVYSLRAGRWREIDFEINVDVRSDGVYLKGRYYWLNHSTRNLLSFDMSNESFGSLDLPPGTDWLSRGKGPHIMDRGDSLVCVVESYTFEVWIMDGGGSWAKRFTIEWDPQVIGWPVGFWKEDEMLMEIKGDDLKTPSYSAYNLYTKELKKLPIPGITSSYIESLVSVKARNNDTLEETK